MLANGNAAAGYRYDAAGNLLATRFGSGVTNLFQYDTLNRLTNSAWNLNASSLASFFYQLGLTGNRTNLSENVNGKSRGYQWLYDNLYRLTNETVSVTAPTGTLGYGFDAVGNRTNRSGSIGSLGSQILACNTNDWLSTDIYDSNGNTLWSTNGSVHGPYYYDVLNRLTNYNNSVYLTYNGDGDRASKTVAGTITYYLVDDRNPSGYAQVLEEYQGASLTRIYNYGLNLISQRQISGGTVSYYGYDGNGSVRFLTSAAGVLTDTNTYDAYGMLIYSATNTPNNYLYCGQQYDPDLGLYYNRARYLNPNTGRFWTMDSYAGSNEEPLSLHKYLYCQGNPITGVDPSGHDDINSLVTDISMNFHINSLIQVAAPEGVLIGACSGPDITVPLMQTIDNVDQTFMSASRGAKSSGAIWMLTPQAARGWDILPFYDLGHGDFYPPGFGKNATLGWGPGDRTVQYSYGGSLKVYHASAINYILWGDMFRLCKLAFGDPAYSESTAINIARAYKDIAYNGDQADEAAAFIKLGYEGANPSSAALPIRPNSQNVAKPAIYDWKWVGFHGLDWQ